MKKIISVLTISALALGSVFAADVSLQYTQKGLISTNEGGTSKKLDLNGYKADVKGDVVFSVSNDNAGVLLDIDPWYNDTVRNEVSNNSKIFDQYYGWVKFFDGKMKLQSGVWGERTVNRMTADAGKWEDAEYERYKPGVINGTLGADISRFAAFNGNKSLTTALTYDDGALSVTVGAITNDFKTSSDEDTTTKSGFGFNIAYSLDEDTKITAILKTPTDQSVAFAAFVDKKGFEIFDRTFNFVAGATVAGQSETDNTSSSSLNNGLEAAVDLRVRYEISDTVALTSMNNFSYTGNYTGSDGEGLKTIWNMASLAVQATDAIKIQLTGEWYYEDLSKSDNGLLEIIPGVTYSPVEGTLLTGGIIIKTEGWKNPSESSIAIPFVLSVKL